MAAESFVRLKGRTTYFRRKIPSDLSSRLASTEICFRLGVVDRDSAVLLGRRLAVTVDAFFVSVRRDQMLSSKDLSAVLDAAMAEWRKTVQPVPVPLVSTREQAVTLATLADGLMREQGDGSAVVGEQFVTEAYAAAGVDTPQDPATLRLTANVLCTGMAAHYLKTAATLARQGGLDQGFRKLPASEWENRAERLLSQYANDGLKFTPKAPPVAAATPLATQPPSPTPAPVTGASHVSTKFDREAGTTFETQALYLVDERIKTRQVGPGAKNNLIPSLNLWKQILGNEDIRGLTP